MDIINFFVGLLKDPRAFIAGWIITLGPVWVYTPLFLIVFVETGLVFFPFLPGDSLLFAAGVFSADGGGLNIAATLIVFYAAAILGNTSNYWIARFFGARIIDSGRVKALTKERMDKLDYFFQKYGGLTIVITRFMPFFRTFAPFIAGMGHMNFSKFTLFNTIGGVAWYACSCLWDTSLVVYPLFKNTSRSSYWASLPFRWLPLSSPRSRPRCLRAKQRKRKPRWFHGRSTVSEISSEHL